jgi:hypothetical protein
MPPDRVELATVASLDDCVVFRLRFSVSCVTGWKAVESLSNSWDFFCLAHHTATFCQSLLALAGRRFWFWIAVAFGSFHGRSDPVCACSGCSRNAMPLGKARRATALPFRGNHSPLSLDKGVGMVSPQCLTILTSCYPSGHKHWYWFLATGMSATLHSLLSS